MATMAMKKANTTGNVWKEYKFKKDVFAERNKKKTKSQEKYVNKLHKYTPISSVEEIETAFQSRIKTYAVKNVNAYKDPNHFLNYVKVTVTGLISKHLKLLKVNMKFFTEYKRGIGENIEYVESSFKTKNEIILKSTNLEEYYTNSISKIIAEMRAFEAKGSQWALDRIFKLEVRINKYVPFKGSSYADLPEKIKTNQASVLSVLHQVQKDPQRVNKYIAYEHEFDDSLKGLEFPMKLDSIATFEKRSGISINIICPLKTTKNKTDKHINLHYIKDQKNDHYCWIKSISRLIASQVTNNGHKIFICDRCLQHFYSVNKLKDPEQDCRDHDGVRVELPSKGKKMTY
ncbi:hypothetical protein PR048_007419 [Dryococelus australis]|uniref:Uncharacterized protein n=1 Tax=Dryococelus australis TaxID=614101 RepID=A0ABQ9HV44_9NEOP|nr:hypothetical protein PR048_007419 [Dryococelus australis]